MAKLGEWSALATVYLDSREDRRKALTPTEVRNHLYERRRLQVHQARDVLLAWLLSGHIAAAADGDLFDARLLGTDVEVVQRTVSEAERRADELLEGRSPDLAKHLRRLLSRRIEAIPRRLKAWAQFDLESDSTVRRVHRAGEAWAGRQRVKLLCQAAATRNATGSWENSTADEQAAALLVAFTTTTGIFTPEDKAVSLHRAAVVRLGEARRLGVPFEKVRHVLTTHWKALVAYAAMDAAEYARPARVSGRAARAPLIHRQDFAELLAHGGVYVAAPRGGLCGASHKPTPLNAEPAVNMRREAPRAASPAGTHIDVTPSCARSLGSSQRQASARGGR